MKRRFRVYIRRNAGRKLDEADVDVELTADIKATDQQLLELSLGALRSIGEKSGVPMARGRWTFVRADLIG